MLQKRKIAAEPSGAPGIEWRVEAVRGGILRGGGDGLQVPMAGSWRRRCGGKVGDNAQSKGFGVGNYFLLERHGEATAPRVYFYCWCECERGAANKQAERDMWLWATEQGEAWKAGEESTVAGQSSSQKQTL